MTEIERKPLVERQLTAARLRLLDLTMRNRLLNYYSTKRRSVEIVNENPFIVFERLVIKEKAMSFRALYDDADVNYDDAEAPVRFDFEDNGGNESKKLGNTIADDIEKAELNIESSEETIKSDQQTSSDSIASSEASQPSHYLEVGDSKNNPEQIINTEPKRFVDLQPLVVEKNCETEKIFIIFFTK